MELLSGAGSWGCGSTWHGIVDGRVGCLDVALGVIDGGQVGGWEVGRSILAQLIDAWSVRWRWCVGSLGVFNLGGLHG